jgi:hypothetical protein
VPHPIAVAQQFALARADADGEIGHGNPIANMSDADETNTAKVVPLRPTTAARASERKWGGAVMKLGYSIILSLLLRA